jgi:hypothetical protein
MKIKIPRALPKATAYIHHNIFTLTPMPSEGREGEAYEHPSITILFLLPAIKCLSLSLIFILSTPLLHFIPLSQYSRIVARQRLGKHVPVGTNNCWRRRCLCDPVVRK